MHAFSQRGIQNSQTEKPPKTNRPPTIAHRPDVTRRDAAKIVESNFINNLRKAASSEARVAQTISLDGAFDQCVLTVKKRQSHPPSSPLPGR